MKKNIGVLDKIARLSFVLIICALYLVDAVGGYLAIILGFANLYLTVSSFTGTCLFYIPFNYSSIENLDTGSTRKL